VQYDGQSWGSPSVVAGGSALEGVSCPTMSFCAAVDLAGRTVTFGSQGWATPVAIGGDGITSISCVSASFCAAVDHNGRGLTYDGSSWTAPVPVGLPSHPLDAVSCSGSSFCLALDEQGHAFSYAAGSWSGPMSDSLSGTSAVSCSDSSHCVAMDDGGAAASWDAGAWSAAVSDNLVDAGSISCPSRSFCAAVDRAGGFVTFDGSSWSARQIIDTSGGQLISISCPSASFCAAVDSLGKVLVFDGISWSPPATIDANGASSVSCYSPSACVVVDPQGEIVSFDGSSWSSPSSIDSAWPPSWTNSSRLTAVSCPEWAFCAAADSSGYSVLYSSTDPPPAPVNNTPPAISGSPTAGQVLTASAGAWWNGPTNYTYQWQRCSADTCTDIPNANSNAFTSDSTDIGYTLRVEVVAGNITGSSAPADSTQIGPVRPPAPSSISPPAASGEASVGQTLTETHGSWSSTPASYSYQWRRCDKNGTNCANIDAATDQTYTIKTFDEGRTLRVREWATNAGGTGGPAVSAATPVITGPPPPSAPGNSRPPSISGVALVNFRLDAAAGSWAGSPTITYSYQWQRCATSCVDIPGATSSSYTAQRVDRGARLRVVVIASNSWGSGRAESAPTTPVGTQPTMRQLRQKLAAALLTAPAVLTDQQLAQRHPILLTLHVLLPGRVQIRWYSTSRRGAQPKLIANARDTCTARGTALLKLYLTRAGARLLRHTKRLTIQAWAVFLSADGQDAATHASFPIRT
jgi:hypothetical protein